MEGVGTRDGPRDLGDAGCPALPVVKEKRAFRVPATVCYASLGQGNRFIPLPLVSPAACGQAGVHPRKSPDIPSAWPDFSHLHSRRLASPVERPTLDRIAPAPLNIATALLAEAMGGLSLRSGGVG